MASTSPGLVRVNDPEDPRYKNTTDVASGGKEKTANLLADFDHLDGLIPFNDETMLGAVEALREAGRLGEVEDGLAQRHAGRRRPHPRRSPPWDVGHRPARHRRTVASLVVRAPTEDLDELCVASPIGRMITPERAAAWVPWRDRIPYHDLKLADVRKLQEHRRAARLASRS